MGVINLRTEIPGPVSVALMARRVAAVPRGVAHSVPVFAASAEGARVTDVDGNVFIDFAGGIGVMNVGHSAPPVVVALREQVDRFAHVGFSVLPYESYVSLAERLARVSPGAFPKKTLLVNSGAEAIENAIKIARCATGRPGVLCFEDGFHGRTLLALSITSKVTPYKVGYAPFVSDVVRVPYAYCYRCAYRAEYPSCGIACVDEIEHHLKRHADPHSLAAACGRAGAWRRWFRRSSNWLSLGSREAVPALRDHADCRRSADRFRADGSPIRLRARGRRTRPPCHAKSLAAGMPLAAVIGRAELMDRPIEGGLGGTVRRATRWHAPQRTAVLDMFESGELLHRAEAIGARIEAHARGWAQACPIIGDIRRRGAMVGIELVKDRVTREPAKAETQGIIASACRQGVILIAAGTYGNVVRFLAPLTITDEELDEGLAILAQCFTAAVHKLAPS
jgi:4-aminobutyrate aminotransferase/(S)-3-amino-2-methylpropionate transaminase